MTAMKRLSTWLAAFALICVPAAQLQAAKIVLKDGRVIFGRYVYIPGMAEQPKAASEEGAPNPHRIAVIDDNLARRFVPKQQIAEIQEGDSSGIKESFDIWQPVLRGGRMVAEVGSIINIEPFDEHGRRTYSMQSSTGRIDVIQGITEITPYWTKVEGLKGHKWDMRIATSSIPRETLDAILANQIDEENVEHRLKVVRLFLESERYADARVELDELIAEFPDLGERYAATLRDTTQLNARRILKEIDVRQTAGQNELAYVMLSQFPADDVAGVILQEVREKLGTYNVAVERRAMLLSSLRRHLWEATSGHTPLATVLLSAGLSDSAVAGPAGTPAAGLPLAALVIAAQATPDSALSARLAPILDEIAAELSLNTLDRLSAYGQLVDDPALLPSEKLALAISGWIVGSDEATANLPTALSMVETRALVQRYLVSTKTIDRELTLEAMGSQEAGTAPSIARILAQMKPPLESPAPHAQSPGFFELTIPGGDGGPELAYYVQLPPEYDPYRRYPTIVTLHAGGSDPLRQIEWWCGDWDADHQRAGQAPRHGYIVIAPAWSKPQQRGYEYSAREHAAVLGCLRDACRRFSIDTDRVYLSGHSMGGNAAWDVGLAHPDLWAGVIPIVATSEKYCGYYWENARRVPFYVVTGELDGDKVLTNAKDLDRCLKKPGFDFTVVEFLGRGHEHFSDEILNLFDWMGRKRRDVAAKEIECRTMRTWDNYFWWLEIEGLPPKVVVEPEDWPPPRNTFALTVTGTITDSNGINVKSGTDRVAIWLSPELVDFDRRCTLTINGDRRQVNLEPDLAILLEDARTRADRAHPFWTKLEFGR